MSHLADARHWSRHAGAGTVARVAAGWAARRLAGRGHDMYVQPSLDDMLRAAGGHLHTSAEDVLTALGWRDAPWDTLRMEYAEAVEQLTARYAQVGGNLPYPTRYAVEQQTGLLLYALVRVLRPAVLVETGVANGHSTSLVLAALSRNGHGELHSLDVGEDVGVLVEDRRRWTLTVSSAERAPVALKEQLRNWGPVDVFFHDSDHRYLNQVFEYRSAWPWLRPGGILVSDDVDDSRAFFDFCADLGHVPSLLFDGRKVLGALRA